MVFEKIKARLFKKRRLRWEVTKSILRGNSLGQSSEKFVLTPLRKKCGIVFGGVSILMVERSSWWYIKFITWINFRISQDPYSKKKSYWINQNPYNRKSSFQISQDFHGRKSSFWISRNLHNSELSFRIAKILIVGKWIEL